MSPAHLLVPLLLSVQRPHTVNLMQPLMSPQLLLSTRLLLQLLLSTRLLLQLLLTTQVMMTSLGVTSSPRSSVAVLQMRDVSLTSDDKLVMSSLWSFNTFLFSFVSSFSMLPLAFSSFFASRILEIPLIFEGMHRGLVGAPFDILVSTMMRIIPYVLIVFIFAKLNVLQQFLCFGLLSLT